MPKRHLPWGSSEAPKESLWESPFPKGSLCDGPMGPLGKDKNLPCEIILLAKLFRISQGEKYKVKLLYDPMNRA